jgi:predicted dehydrogenase
MNAFRTLIIGTGFGTRVMQGCYEEAGMEVAVVSPREEEAVRAACAEPFDLVSVHAPPFLHARYVNWALDHGRNVLCDKPFGVSAGESRQMLQRAQALGVVHLLNFEFRQDPSRARVKELIDAGAIGSVTHVNWQFFISGSSVPVRKHGWQFDKDMGGGWIRINGTHMFDALRWLVGEIAEVDARARIDVCQRPDAEGALHESTAEDGFTALMTLENGASVVIDTSWAVPGTLPDRWVLVGTEGMIEISEGIEIYAEPMYRDTRVTLFTARGRTEERFGPYPGDAHLPSMRRWAKVVHEAVSERRQIAPSFVDGVAAAEVVDRLHVALERGGETAP